MPPPRTLSSSFEPYIVRSFSSVVTFIIDIGSVFLTSELEEYFVFVIVSSIIEFHDPHAVHFPIHLEDSFPHSLHTNTVLLFKGVTSKQKFLARVYSSRK